ncbi:MAG: hypothetical protein WC941_08440 [Candidatus Bathyarchaeia archaeon]
MTVLESSEQQELVRMSCMFVADYTCQLEVEEIPLEVCRLCVEARKSHGDMLAKTVKRTVRKTEAPKPVAEPRIAESELESLSSLDRLFVNDEIALEEYVRRRGEAVKRLQEAKARRST